MLKNKLSSDILFLSWWWTYKLCAEFLLTFSISHGYIIDHMRSWRKSEKASGFTFRFSSYFEENIVADNNLTHVTAEH